MSDYRIFWGDTHNNVYVGPETRPQTPDINELCRYASTFLDFYAPAYYTAVMFSHPVKPEFNPDGRYVGVKTEGTKTAERVRREWAEVESATAAAHRPGRFVTFPCYEWQGNGEWGDHNVVHRQEGRGVLLVPTSAELYAGLRGTDSIAIPHHTAYAGRHRSKNWEVFDERISPFAEIFSCHGCSETDEDWMPMRRNPHMGPKTGGGTYAAALDRGLRVGAICSPDSFGFMPGWYGRGLMACLARDLTREGLWEAFLARRVYGVTGDRIALDFTLNGAEMGRRLPGARRRAIAVRVRGSDAIDRIEILRNNRVVATYCHQGRWDPPPAGRVSRFKVRVECGWGAFPNEIPLASEEWRGELSVAGGRIAGWEPCWVDFGQTPAELDGGRARFGLRTRQFPGAYIADLLFNADVFEIEAAPEQSVALELNGVRTAAPLAELCRSSRVLWLEEEARRHVAALTGLREEDHERVDTFYHAGRKAKVHRAVPEAGYTAAFEWTDDEPLRGETHYRVRVEQRNGQRAWSSPIWVAGSE